MILTATQSIEGRQVSQYLWTTSAEAVSGISLFRDFGTGFRNLVSGHSETYERELGMARETMLAELYQRAKTVGADAVVGVGIGCEILGADNGVFVVTTSGTMVTLVQVAATVLKLRSGAWAPPTSS